MKSYDVVIVGAATSGSYFAHRIAEQGHSVLVIDAKPREKVGAKYDIFHIGKPDFARFGLPFPEEGDDLAFTFTGSVSYSAFGRHGKPSNGTTVGMHMHAYTMRLNRWAAEAGAEFCYDASFEDLLFEDGRIAGVVFTQGGEQRQVRARLVADCSGIPSVARRKLPESYGVENFEISPADMFYVTLRYVRYPDEKDRVRRLRGWTYYKTWEAPEADPNGAILGVGANLSFDMGERIYAEFTKAIELPQHELKYIERGATPYRRPPYSFVADGFIATGDAACLTKPSAGEGVTSSMVQIDIAQQTVNALLGGDAYLSREKLWPINKLYIEAQGKMFASQLATLVGAVATSAEENDFFFEKDIIFSQKTFDGMASGEPLAFSTGELMGMALKMFSGVLTGRLRFSTIRSLLKAMGNGDRVTKLYEAFPETPAGFEDWCARADALWAQCGSMADVLKEE